MSYFKTGEDWKEIHAIKLKDDDIITVCNNCFRACCWIGEFMCDESYGAGTFDLPVKILRLIQPILDQGIGGEHEEYWQTAKWERGE